MKKTTFAFLAIFFLSLTGCSYFSDKDNYKYDPNDNYLSDQVITAKVKAALIQDPDIKNNNVSVNTHNGIVQLSGFVDTKYEVKKAARIAASIPGVMKVKNHLIEY